VSDPSRNRILLLGWDGADWKIIKRLLDAGEMPHLATVIEDGVMGNLASLPPMLSPMLWTTVATGKRADKHGVHGFLEPRPDGQGIRPVSSTSIRVATLWKILAAHGRQSAVVGWYGTHPADRVGGTVVSDLVARAHGRDFESWPLPPGSVAPDELRELAADLRVHPGEVDADQLLYFVPRALEIDQRTDRRLRTLARLIAQCATTHAAGTYLAERGDWDLLGVYYETIDRMCHHFMPFHPPRMEQIAPDDFERYRDVVDQCYRFHDLMLGRYLQLVGPETTVVIVSDHGFHSDHLRPRAARDAWGQPVQWHRRYGILVARGPGIRRDQLVFGASLLDVAPTVLAMLGLPIGRDMEGRVLTQMFDPPVAPSYVESHDALATGGGADAAEDDPWAAQEAIAQLVALGYVDAPPADVARAIDQVTAEKLLNLAEVHLSARDHPRAIETLEELLRRRPGDVVGRGRLAQAHLELGHVDECRRLVDDLLAGQPDSHWANVARGLMHFRQREWAEALASFLRVERDAPEMPTLHYRMGVVHLQQEQWAEARRAFETALELDGDDAGAYDGLGLALYRQEQHEQAIEAFMRSIALLYRQPLVHFHLGVALAATGRLDAAVDSLERALAWAPDLAAAHESLAGIHRARGDAERAVRHLSLAQTIRRAPESPDRN
jgi:tetratricopeptide (TPR) repeat protein